MGFSRINGQTYPGQLWIRASRSHPFGQTVEFQAAIVNGARTMVAQPVVLAEVEEGAACPPFMSLPLHQAQILMDELWNCGLRPSEGTGSAGAMAAVQAHLADMRALASKALDTQLPAPLREVLRG